MSVVVMVSSGRLLTLARRWLAFRRVPSLVSTSLV